MATAGRMLPAAQPHIELITIIAVPPFAFSMKASTSSGVRSSSIPRRVSSLRIGAIMSSG